MGCGHPDCYCKPQHVCHHTKSKSSSLTNKDVVEFYTEQQRPSTAEKNVIDERPSSDDNNHNGVLVHNYHRTETGEGISMATGPGGDNNSNNAARRVQNYHRTETSEGISVATVSMHVGDFPSETMRDPNNNNNNTNVPPVPTTLVESEKKSLSHMVSAISDVTNDDMDMEDVNETPQDDGEQQQQQQQHGDDDSIELLINTVRQKVSQETHHIVNLRDERYEKAMENLLQDRAQLERILIARKHDMDLSIKLFFEQVRFRARYNPQHITASDIPNAAPSGAWRLCGYTREGIIISNYKLKYWNPSDYGTGKNLDAAIEEYTKYVVYMIELQISHMKSAPTIPQQFVVLFDLTGFTPSLVFRKNVRLMIRKLIYVAQAQYPERLYKTLLVNAPYGFETAWKLIQPLLDEKTASKIHFCSNLKELTNEIDPKVLSRAYGGEHEEYPIFPSEETL